MANFDIDIEKIVLGSLIIEPDLLNRFSEKISEHLFADLNNQLIFDVVYKLWKNNHPIDMVIVIKELSKLQKKHLDKYIIDITSSIGSSANIEYYLMKLVEYSVKRDFVTKFTILLNYANNQDQDIFHIRDKAFEYFDNLFIDKFIERNRKNKAFGELIESVEAQSKKITNGIIPGIKSSLAIINKVSGGWQNSDLVIIAGRPSMGKTAFMIQQMIDVSVQGLPVGCFSLEMAAEQITARGITNISEIPNSALLRKGMTIEQWERFYSYKDYMQNLPIYIDDTAGISIQNLRIKAKMMVMRFGIKILFVDYLQLITNSDAKNREQEISSISRGLKGIAKELNIPVIALSQLSRNLESRPDKRPKLSDLRESGAIEQDADIVGFLFRPEYYNIDLWEDFYDNEPTKNQVEILISKNRQGGLLAERCLVDFPTSKFRNL